MKRVLSVQDLSCLGRCSLTVTLPVLSAMGCECSVLPTAVLSTNTAFPEPYIHSLTQDMDAICRHWETVGARFDAVSIGYLSDPTQAEAAEKLLDRFGCFAVLDPAMGDRGKLYSGITEDHVQAMAQLCRKSRILLPNVTEAALLTGLPYRETAEPGYLEALTAGLLAFGAEAVVITDVSLQEGQTGFAGVSRKAGSFSYQVSRIPRHFHGTGDLFCAVVTGGLLSGLDLESASRLAARFVERSISATPAVTPYGVEFEAQLPWLWQQLQGAPQARCAGLCPGF